MSTTVQIFGTRNQLPPSSMRENSCLSCPPPGQTRTEPMLPDCTGTFACRGCVLLEWSIPTLPTMAPPSPCASPSLPRSMFKKENVCLPVCLSFLFPRLLPVDAHRFRRFAIPARLFRTIAPPPPLFSPFFPPSCSESKSLLFERPSLAESIHFELRDHAAASACRKKWYG